MGKVEIERKYIVDKELLPPLQDMLVESPAGIEQSYLGRKPSVRVRLSRKSGEARAFLTVKGKGKLVRAEYEYEIPYEDGENLILLGTGHIQKTRWKVSYQGKVWEIDFFHGPLEGLVLAECELETETEPLAVPPWAAKEVTFDPTFTNQALSDLSPEAILYLSEKVRLALRAKV